MRTNFRKLGPAMIEFSTPDDGKELPINVVLKQAGISLTLWRKIKREGSIFINGLKSTDYRYLRPGDKVTLSWPVSCNITPYNNMLSLGYEDEYLIVVDKPAGILVHPTGTETNKTIANMVINYYRKQNTFLGFHPVHRLDRNTSGLVLIAKHPHIQHWFSADKSNFQRYYFAMVQGIPCPTIGSINLPIGRNSSSIIERQVRSDGQAAITHYKVVQRFNNASLLRISLDTGRTHQIRVHMAAIGCPIIGDDLYGQASPLISRQALHAYRIIFRHPRANLPVSVFSPLPQDMLQLISRYNLK